MPKWFQNDPKVTTFCKKSEYWWFVLPHNFIKPFKYVGNMNVSWKQTFMYPKWLHNYLKVDPKWSKVIFIRQKWPQSHPKVTLKWSQNEVNSPMATQSTSQKCEFPVYGPTWVDEWRHSGRKMTLKWSHSRPKMTSSHPRMSKLHPKLPKLNSKWPQVISR